MSVCVGEGIDLTRADAVLLRRVDLRVLISCGGYGSAAAAWLRAGLRRLPASAGYAARRLATLTVHPGRGVR